eukprot:EG_transcript_14781
MAPPRSDLFSRRAAQSVEDPAQWARHAATLHAVQALTTETVAAALPESPGRGVRWLRDVLRAKDTSSPTVDHLPRSASQYGCLRRKGLVFDGDGEWQCSQAGSGSSISHSMTFSSHGPSGGRPAGIALPRTRSLFCPGPNRMRSTPWCPSQNDFDSDEEDLFQGSAQQPDTTITCTFLCSSMHQ